MTMAIYSLLNTIPNQIMETFESISQYDKSFDYMVKKGYSCSLFGIISAYNYMNPFGTCGNTTKEMHEKNIIDASYLCNMYDISEGITFEILVGNFTNLDKKKITATSVDLIVNNIVGFDQMFPQSEKKYVTLILKNEKYIAIFVDHKNSKYCIRDCHEKTQHNFSSFEVFKSTLSTMYQLTHNIDIGVDYSNYSSIEFMIIDQPFETNI